MFEQVAWSMEYFTVAHEFGHHVLNHRGVYDDPKMQEFQADTFAAKVCERLEFEPFPRLSNPYTRTGAGASLILLADEILHVFDKNSDYAAEQAETHPTPTERIARISERHVLEPKQYAMDQDFNGTVTRIMNAVSGVMREFLDAGGSELVTFVRQQRLKAEMDLRSSTYPI